jgi:hypothetical protein
MKLEITNWGHSIFIRFRLEDLKNDIRHKQFNQLNIYRLN